MGTKLLLNSYLTFCFLFCSIVALAQDNCKEIKASIEVFQPGQKTEKASVKIDFHGQSQSSIAVFIFGIKGQPKKEIEGEEIKDLNKGRYLLVFTSRREEDNFCLKQTEFTIK